MCVCVCACTCVCVYDVMSRTTLGTLDSEFVGNLCWRNLQVTSQSSSLLKYEDFKRFPYIFKKSVRSVAQRVKVV